MASRQGPLTLDDLRDIWRGALDKAYYEPFERVGDGNGLEFQAQAWAQYARVSRGVDRTTQQMYLLPWSGQTSEPAGGGVRATVTLMLSRTRYLERPLVLEPGLFVVDQQVVDWGENGGVEVDTGRRYIIDELVVFQPGDSGPKAARFIAEKFGEGYNNPAPETITAIQQPGANFRNVHAAVDSTGPRPTHTTILESAFVLTPDVPDTFVTEHIGQWVTFLTGANAGAVGRIIFFEGADLSVIPQRGSKVQLDVVMSLGGSSTVGTFQAGEPIRVTDGPEKLTGTLYLLTESNGLQVATLKILTGDVADSVVPGATLVGLLSGATMTVDIVLYRQHFVSEGSGAFGPAAWRVLDWAVDLGMTATNLASPTGGRAPWLDEIGAERNIGRSPNESDDSYRQRLHQIADVVTPNAIRRTLYRVLNDLPWCFREVGYPELPGFYFDGDPSDDEHIDAWDADCYVCTSNTLPPGDQGAPMTIDDATTGSIHWVRGFYGRPPPVTAAPFDGVGPPFTWIFVRTSGLIPATGMFQVTDIRTGTVIPLLTVTRTPASVARRWRIWLDYEQFRGFFMVGVPQFAAGEFGFAYDDYPTGAYDATPYDDFYDGYPRLNAQIYTQVWQAVEAARAGGVAWELYQELEGCP